GWRRSSAADPAVEEPPLGALKIVADDDTDVRPFAAAKREAVQRRRLEPDQQREQQTGNEACPRRYAEKLQQQLKRDEHDHVAEQYQPHLMPQHPERTEQKCPE